MQCEHNPPHCIIPEVRVSVFLSFSSHGKPQRWREMNAVSKAKTFKWVNCWCKYQAAELIRLSLSITAGLTCSLGWPLLLNETLRNFLFSCNFPLYNNGFSLPLFFSQPYVSYVSHMWALLNTLFRRYQCFENYHKKMLLYMSQRSGWRINFVSKIFFYIFEF